MKTILFTVIAFITLMTIHIPSLGQTGKQQDTIMAPGQTSRLVDQIEKSAEALDIDHDYSDLIADLADLASNPVNLNAAKEDDLNAIPCLTPGQRKNLFNYLTTYGEVFSIYELQSIPGFDSALIQNIRPFISISPASNPNNW